MVHEVPVPGDEGMIVLLALDTTVWKSSLSNPKRIPKHGNKKLPLARKKDSGTARGSQSLPSCSSEEAALGSSPYLTKAEPEEFRLAEKTWLQTGTAVKMPRSQIAEDGFLQRRWTEAKSTSCASP